MLTGKHTHDVARVKHPSNITRSHTGTNGFPFSNFKHSLTLFSKFFSSFPHGTFSLSVYCLYLALDGIYHPLRAAFPSNSTRRKRTVRTASHGTDGVITLYDSAFQPNSPQVRAGRASIHYNSMHKSCDTDFQFELFPLHSPLLGESLLVSFPPLSYMLKSSGSSYLISGPIMKWVWGVFSSHNRRMRGYKSFCFGILHLTVTSQQLSEDPWFRMVTTLGMKRENNVGCMSAW